MSVAMLSVFIFFLGLGYSVATDNKIYNGEDAKPYAYPWMAEILTFDSDIGQYIPLCGGALISKRYVVTSRNCLGNGVSTLQINLGEHNLTDEGTEQILTAQTFYMDRDGKHDFALIKLASNARLTAAVQPIDVLRSQTRFTNLVEKGATLTLTGWGEKKYYTGWAVSSTLQELKVRLVDSQTCQEKGNDRKDTEFCYEPTVDDCRGACVGDRGAPIVYITKKGSVLVGLHSRSFGVFDGCAGGIKAGDNIVNIYSLINDLIQGSS